MRLFTTLVLSALFVCVAATANADELSTSRDIQAAVDSYLATSEDGGHLVGGPGSAGYDDGFWIRGGDYLLRINALLQARFESSNWDDEDDAAAAYNGRLPGTFAGDTSGFSLPRATIKLSGEAPCDTCYYIELEFGHFGSDVVEQATQQMISPFDAANQFGLGAAVDNQSYNYDSTREAWIEWCNCDAFNIRFGQVAIPTTRQMMVNPGLQQFIDVSMASAALGTRGPGFTDRNRDHGLLVHGAFGCNGEWSYILGVTNGDGGDSIRNVLDHRTSDNLMYSARLNWAFMGAIGYEEGALNNQTCSWAGELGVWVQSYADRSDKPHVAYGDVLNYGVDLALLYGGFSLTAAYTVMEITDIEAGPGAGLGDFEATAWLLQLGYHFPGTAWEIAARASMLDSEIGAAEGDLTELAFAVNYYLNGHSNKLQLDVTFLEGNDQIVGFWAPHPGFVPLFDNENSQTMLRFQWQLAL